MQINIGDIWASSIELRHRQFLEDILSRSLPARSPIMNQLLFRHAGKLAVSRPHVLREVIGDIEFLKSAYSKQERADFDSDCKKLFDYDRFSTKGSNRWNVYSLCMESKYRLCPYCQQSLAVTIYRDRKSKALRPTLDHFYPKHKFPYLALSLYNLVPSCYSCNSSLKGASDFYAKPHLHPYEDDEVICYDLDIELYIDHRRKGGATPTPKVTMREVSRSHPLYAQAQRSLKTFLAQDRLEICEPEINTFIETLLAYSEERLDEINRTILSLSLWPLSEESALGFSRTNYKNEWLGALKRDLYDISWRR